jgi:protein-L-isoaspartate O-methyltransferase
MNDLRQSQLNGRGRLRELRTETNATALELDHERNRFEALKDSTPIVVEARQLFPTPPDLAARVVELAAIEPGQRLLEPSAGMGALLNQCFHLNGDGQTVAVEINQQLADHLRGEYPQMLIHCGDFLECGGELGTFDRIVMNPPFTNRGDIKHIEHARCMLNHGGRLVAICANGRQQRAKLMPEASEWIDLPAGSFKESGTNVNAAVVIYDA